MSGAHGLACKRSAGRMGRHQYLNDIIWQAINRANVPAIKEPQGLVRSDGKRPDGVTQIPRSEGECVTWDVTVTDTLAASNVRPTSLSAGSAAEAAAARKEQKYSELMRRYSFVPIAFETMGTINASGEDFIDEIGKRTHALSDDNRERGFLWQRLSVGLQRYNSICFRGTFQPIDKDLTSDFSPKEKRGVVDEVVDSQLLGGVSNVELRNALDGRTVDLLMEDNSLCYNGLLIAVSQPHALQLPT